MLLDWFKNKIDFLIVWNSFFSILNEFSVVRSIKFFAVFMKVSFITIVSLEMSDIVFNYCGAHKITQFYGSHSQSYGYILSVMMEYCLGGSRKCSGWRNITEIYLWSLTATVRVQLLRKGPCGLLCWWWTKKQGMIDCSGKTLFYYCLTTTSKDNQI